MRNLAISFVLLNTLDIGLTLHFVGAGISRELNPFMAQVLTWPLPMIVLYKTVLPIILVIGLVAVSRVATWRLLNMRNVLIAAVAGEMLICLFNLTGLIFS